MTIDHYLERGKESKNALYLVQDRSLWEVRDESDRVGFSRTEHHVVVEAEIGVAANVAQHPRQRGLAALTRPVNQHDRTVCQRFREERLCKAWPKLVRSHIGCRKADFVQLKGSYPSN